MDGQVKSPMKLLATTTLTTLDGGIATMDDIETTIRVMLDESFRVSLILGGVFVALLAVLVLTLMVCLLVTELQKARRLKTPRQERFCRPGPMDSVILQQTLAERRNLSPHGIFPRRLRIRRMIV